jgi:hypothetical protein
MTCVQLPEPCEPSQQLATEPQGATPSPKLNEQQPLGTPQSSSVFAQLAGTAVVGFSSFTHVPAGAVHIIWLVQPLLVALHTWTSAPLQRVSGWPASF